MRERLDFGWRLVGTGLAFAGLFLGGAFLAVTVFPAISWGVRDATARRDRTQRVIHHLFRLYVGTLRILRILDLEIVDAERLRNSGGRLIVSNHPTLLDVVLLMALVPRAQCIVKKELWSSPYLGGAMRAAGYIRNDLEPEPLLAACGAALAGDNALLIFPEGTRTRPGQPMRLHRGFANIATLLEADIQLVTITCDPPTLMKGDAWWQIPPHRPRFRVVAGNHLQPKDWVEHQYRSLAVRRLTRHIEEYYAERLPAR